ncbi:hypothetical protein JTE90_004040 [Oedothorax gibbosus]|uniref:RNase H type-1 domain-containing protein n=1 Tax=Oedothorax gibbosus TaxID=931172 RepID=A0AAV6U4L4_9ARAC|nr:hypothetical protein JTE90_004040 [Oedothorax gibbosus]
MVTTALEGSSVETNFSQNLEGLIQYHFEISDSEPTEETTSRGAIFDPITKDELEYSVNSQGLDKAPGPDGMGPSDVEPTNLKKDIYPGKSLANLCLYPSGLPSNIKADICAFTDGSKSDAGVGSGYVLRVALAALYPKSPIILKIKTLCTELADKTINLGWVKAHVGLMGNEIADSIAGAAAEFGVSSPAVLSLLGPLAAASLGGGWSFPALLGFGGLNLRGGRVFGLACPYLHRSPAIVDIGPISDIYYDPTILLCGRVFVESRKSIFVFW